MIYFIQSGDRGPIKIGYVAREDSCERRMAALQIGNPEILRLLAVVPGSREQELMLHARFRKYRVRGEWFWPAAPGLDELIDGRSSIPVVDDSEEALEEALLQVVSERAA